MQRVCSTNHPSVTGICDPSKFLAPLYRSNKYRIDISYRFNKTIRLYDYFFVFMEEVHLPQSQVTLRESEMILYKVFWKLY